MDKQRITKFLYAYSKILMIASALSFFLAASIVIYSDSPGCYEEVAGDNLFSDSDCMVVEDVEAFKQKYNGYKIIGSICVLGYLIVQPRWKYERIAYNLGLHKKER